MKHYVDQENIVKNSDNEIINLDYNRVVFWDGSEIDLTLDNHGDPHKKYEIEYFQLKALINNNAGLDVEATLDNINDHIEDIIEDVKADEEYFKERDIEALKKSHQYDIENLNERIEELENMVAQLEDRLSEYE